jgi:hypothetical protein
MKGPKALEDIREYLPLLDDWQDEVPDGWDYEKVLWDNRVTVAWTHECVDHTGKRIELPPGMCGWGFGWEHGGIHIGQTTETIARKAAALFVSLWLRKVSASFCDKLMDGFICYLERQENESLTFLVETFQDSEGQPHHSLFREGMEYCDSFRQVGKKVMADLKPGEDEEVIVTFTKRKKQ